MTLHKLAAGSGYTYLTRQVAAHDRAERSQLGLAAYYEEKGESPGRWLGSGLTGLDLASGDVVTEEQMRLLFGQGRHPFAGHPDAERHGWGKLGRAFPQYDATSLRQLTARAFSDYNTQRGVAWNHPIPPVERSRVRTEVATVAFVERHGRQPLGEDELTGFVTSSSRPAQASVAGYDLTFSPVKSVSALWALASPDVAQQVVDAHEAAVRSTLALLEAEVAFTRVGRAGIRQVPVTGLVAAAFDHRDSRTGDPDLHTHVVISNKVQALPGDGGRWLTLDGRIFFKAKVVASEHYNTQLEAELVARLGVRFVERPSGEGKRPVREIAGMDLRLLQAWSSRRQAIEHRQRDLASAFRVEHLRAPTTIESIALAQQANLETRPDKHEPRSEAEQRRMWWEQAYDLNPGLGRSEDVRQMLAQVLGARGVRTQDAGGCEAPEVVADRVMEVLESSRATWQVWHVRAETLRQARAVEVPLAELEEYVRDVEGRVLKHLSVPVGVPPDLCEPDALRRPDGESAYAVHGSATYSSATMLAAESELLDLGLRRDGRRVDESTVEAVIADAARRGLRLDRSQAGMVRGLALGGCRVQVALAPAGSGKTTALAVLARAWEAGGGEVVGLAPTAVAADELSQATGVMAETLAKFLHELSRSASTARGPRDGVVAGRGVGVVGPGTLVVVDEAAMAGTRDLAAAVRHIVRAGASVRLVGDDQQLSAVAARGVFRDLAEQGHANGTTATLTELHRFAHPDETAATLAVRDGDPAGLGYYFDQGRVHAGDVGTQIEAAYAAWTADQRAGRTSLLLTATRDTVRELNERARENRLAGLREPRGAEVGLADGTHASAGDLVVTRQNDRSLRSRDGSWVKNGERWRVLEVRPDGGMVLARPGRGGHGTTPSLALPATYVAHHVQLGYASTIHGAQGSTVDTTHTVLTGAEPRQSLYVAVSRGRESNHLYLGSPTATEDGVGLTVAELNTGPREVLNAILERDGREQSATSVDRGDAARELRETVLRYLDALPVLAEKIIGEQQLAALDAAFDRWLPGITEQPAYPGLRAQVALRWVDGEAPKAVVDSARWSVEPGRLADSGDAAAALTPRVSESGMAGCGEGPLPWLPRVPAALHADYAANEHLEHLINRIARLSERVAEEANAPGARGSLHWLSALPEGVGHQLAGDLAIWRAAQGVPAVEQRATGRPQHAGSARKHQSRLEWRVTAGGEEWAVPEDAARDELLSARTRTAERLSHLRSNHASGPRLCR